ncbi:MAG: inorganic diphosphatase, partial [Oscillospiraceae bacterium]|nr:inorganic diphosphatase [Oscillospiraceae bacterium]
MNVWHDIHESRISKGDFLVYIEIPKGSNKKYELDKDSGLLILDRVLHTATHYPANYGFIPKTLAEDGDPLDVLVICSEVIDPGVLVQCYPIGVIKMEDGGELDEKIIAIPFNDPSYNSYRSIDALPYHIFKEMRHFFGVYKQLEGKSTAVQEALANNSAMEVIAKCIAAYKLKFPEIAEQGNSN